MPASFYRPKDAPFLTEIMVDATLPELNRRAERVAAAARSIASSVMEPDNAARYVPAVQVVGSQTLTLGGGPRSGVLVGPVVPAPFARNVEAKHGIMARAAGAA